MTLIRRAPSFISRQVTSAFALGCVTALCAALVAAHVAAQTLLYPDTVVPTFEPEDTASAKQGYKKCEVSIKLVKQEEGVDFRLNALNHDRLTATSLAVSVVEFTMLNGVPADPTKKPISHTRIGSSRFETTSEMRQADTGDGGRVITLDADSFASLMNLLAGGNYLVGFKRIDKPQETLYEVRDGLKNEVLTQFLRCLQRF